MTRRASALFLALASFLLVQPASAQRHVALVIDNNPSAVTAALPVASDAAGGGPTPAAIARRLSALNYTVMHAERLDGAALRQHVEQFKALAERAEVAVFYFHGSAVDVQGRNHLLAETNGTAVRLDTETIVLDDIAERMKASKANIVLLDAGYNDPLPESITGDNRQPSLANVGERSNFLIVMASQPGKVVRRDGRMRFSKAILSQLDRATGDWSGFGSQLRQQVFQESREEQLPYVRSSIRPGIRLAALPSGTDALPGAGPLMTEAERNTFLSQMQTHLVRLRCYPQGAQLSVASTEQALGLLEEHVQTGTMPRIAVATAGPADFASWLEWAAKLTIAVCPPPARVTPVPVPRISRPAPTPPPPQVQPPRQQIAVPPPPPPAPKRQQQAAPVPPPPPPRARQQPQPERVERAPRQVVRERPERVERSAPSRSARSEGGGGGGGGGSYRAPSGGGGGGGGSGRFSPGAF